MPSPSPSPRCVVVDLGNACWTHHHYTDDIQTRQYRAPEVILGAPYNTPADLWSVACLLFELATGDYLFDPHEAKDGRFTRDEDHIAQMLELLGDVDLDFVKTGKKSWDVFHRGTTDVRGVSELRPWPLDLVLEEKYGFRRADARDFADFLLQMLKFVPAERASALELLHHPWLA